MSTGFTVKLLFNKSTKKVLFAEASKEVVDFLFGLLEMPLASIIKLLTTDKMVGSIGNLFQSVSALNASYLQSTDVKTNLLNPVVGSFASYERLLLPPATPTRYFSCSNNYGSCISYITNARGIRCTNCGNHMKREVTLAVEKVEIKGYVKEVVTYSILDDLTVTPMSTISGITLLNKFKVRDVGVLEEKTTKFGYDEGLALLQASLQSKTVLISDVPFLEVFLVAHFEPLLVDYNPTEQ